MFFGISWRWQNQLIFHLAISQHLSAVARLHFEISSNVENEKFQFDFLFHRFTKLLIFIIDFHSLTGKSKGSFEKNKQSASSAPPLRQLLFLGSALVAQAQVARVHGDVEWAEDQLI